MKTVILLSGGIDSSTLLYHIAKTMETDVFPLSIFYGQKHERELQAARDVAQMLGLARKHKIVDISSIKPLIDRSALVSDTEVPEGHYQAKSMEATVVPNRNMVMLSLAGAYAENIEATHIAYAAHAGDHAIYRDCRPQFAYSMKRVLGQATGAKLMYPFIKMMKWDIVDIGLRLLVPYQMTWSCYNGREKACGKCGTCIERIEAFKKNLVEDPIEYEAPSLIVLPTLHSAIQPTAKAVQPLLL